MREQRPVDRPFAELVEWELDPSRPLTALQEAGSGGDAGAGRSWLREPPRELFGLALSGGGIRSSTFNLGLLQGLATRGLLGCFDYLSTVSGGGYIGGFWTAWRRRNGGGAAFPGVDRPPGASSSSAPGSEPPPIRRLREYGNFLNPRLSLFSFDTGRMVAALVASIIPSLAAAVALLALLTFAWLGVATALMVPGQTAVQVAAAIVLTLGVLAGSELVWRRQERIAGTAQYVLMSALGVAAVAALWLAGDATRDTLVAASRLTPLLLWADMEAGRLLLWPAACWAGAAVLLVIVRFGLSPIAGESLRSAIDRVLSRLLFLAMVWLVTGTLWLAARTLSRDAGAVAEALGLAGTGALGLGIGRLHAFFRREPNKPSGSRLSAFLRPRLAQLLSYAFVVLLTVMVMSLVSSLSAAFAPAAVLGAAAAITLASLLWFEPNEVGLHAFYRDRLTRAFLGAAAARGDDEPRLTESQPDDDIALDDCPRSAPLHLVCCAANDLTTDQQFLNLHRGAVSAVLSPVGFSVGGAWRPWPPKGSSGAKRVATLGHAITASAAAVNSQMGSWSVRLGPAAVFTLAALNLRLGLWWPHPRTDPGRRWLRGLPFYKEMLGRTSAGGEDVHLSDGGHFENMALYELIRRHCRYIIASDCGADPDVAFDDLGNVVRRVREDFGVEIDIDLTPLRPVAGRARQPMVAGDIQYQDGDTGVLLLIKPTLIGDEPADIAQYSRRNAAFPHESTGDQFYDEAQWESYRRLGAHAAHAAFRFLGNGPADVGFEGETVQQVRQRCARIFARARFEWTPLPHGFEENVEGITQCHASLDAVLRLPEAAVLRGQVFRDVADLEGSAAFSSQTVADALPSIPLLREALRQMERIVHLARLDQHAGHPVNLGTMNVFGRWTGAPLFRDWWPTLRSLCSSPFASFMERTFALQPRTGAAIVALDTEAQRVGFAVDSLRLARGGRLELEGRRVLAFHGQFMHAAAEPVAGPQLAVLLCQPIESNGRLLLTWDADDFYVPPGLWGIGVGNQFLTKLSEIDAELWVRIRTPTASGWAARKAAADLVQLYRSAGFGDCSPIPGTAPLPATLLFIEDWPSYQWLYRRRDGKSRLAAPRATTGPSISIPT